MPAHVPSARQDAVPPGASMLGDPQHPMVDESAWVDVIRKMDEVYSRLIEDEVALEQKNAELEQSQQFIVSVLSSMSDVLVVCNEDGLIEQANAALCQLVGLDPRALMGRSLHALLADEPSIRRADEVMKRIASGRIAEAVELNLLDPQNQPVPIEANCTARMGAHGRCLGTVWVGRPTGELKRAYLELQRAHDALKRTQQQLVHSEKMASLGQLVAGVAHELNNPISFVLGNVHALRKYCTRLQQFLSAYDKGLAPEQIAAQRQQLRIDQLLADLPSLLDGTLEGAQRTADIVQGLKRFSARDSEAHTPVNLVQVVERSIQWVQKVSRTGVAIQCAAPAQAMVLGSAGQLQQVLMNLLQNALDAIASQGKKERENGAVHVEVVQDATTVRVHVRDNGPGIAPEHLGRIFDPFFTTKPVGKGTGLGLSVSYGIVEQHGGLLTARNRTDGGAEFTLELPRHANSGTDFIQLCSPQSCAPGTINP